MSYIRQDVHGTSGQDILKINENFMNIFEKVFGDINFSDVDSELQKKINKQWIPVQGEGNLDSSNPLRIRFFIPPNTTKLVSSNFNIITENYRMDSSITSQSASSHEVISIASSTEPAQTRSSSVAPAQTRSSSTEPSQTPTSSTVPKQTKTATSTTVGVSGVSSETVGVTSVSNTTVGVSDVGGGGVTSDWGGQYSCYVDKWGVWNGTRYAAPTQSWKQNQEQTAIGGGYFYTPGRDDMALGTLPGYISGVKHNFIDIYSLQHNHYIESHNHWVPSHKHNVTLQGHTHSVSLKPHTHNISMQPHSHDIEVPAHDHTVTINAHHHTVEIPSHYHDITIPSHSHTINGSVTIPEHSHSLNEGVKISGTNPRNIRFKINGTNFCTVDGNNAKNNLDITEHLKIGEWNVIEIKADTVARAVVYGTVELIAI